MTDERELAEANGLRNFGDVAGQQSVGVAPWPIAQSMAPLIECDDAVTIGELRGKTLPGERIARAAMQQQHWEVVGIAPLDDMEVQAPDAIDSPQAAITGSDDGKML